MQKLVVFADDVKVGEWIRPDLFTFEEKPFAKVLSIRDFPNGEHIALRTQDTQGKQEVKVFHRLFGIEVAGGERAQALDEVETLEFILEKE